MNFVESCRRLIALESTPQHGNKEVAEAVAKMAQEAGLLVELQQETLKGIEQCNVILRSPSCESMRGSHKELLLQTHLDTADAGSFALWTQTECNPFNASIYGDELYGLGAADTKLDILCKMEALKSLAHEPLKKPVVVAGTFGAHSGMMGAAKLLRRKKVDPDLVLVGEPTDFQLMTQGMGLAVVEISLPFSDQEIDYRRNHDLIESSSSQSRIFHGKPAHGSVPSMGDNAIFKMVDYLAQLPDSLVVMDVDGGLSYNTVPASAVLEIDIVEGGIADPISTKICHIVRELRNLELDFLSFCDEAFNPPHPTMNVGTIRTSEDQVQITGSCRILPSMGQQVYDSWMERLNGICSSQGAKFRVTDYKPPFFTSTELAFVNFCGDILREMNLPSKVGAMSAASEASVFHKLGVSCLAFGPGKSAGNSHEPNESISISSLMQATEFYRKLIQRVCL